MQAFHTLILFCQRNIPPLCENGEMCLHWLFKGSVILVVVFILAREKCYSNTIGKLICIFSSVLCLLSKPFMKLRSFFLIARSFIFCISSRCHICDIPVGFCCEESTEMFNFKCNFFTELAYFLMFNICKNNLSKLMIRL